MGLDITAYSKVTYLRPRNGDDWQRDETFLHPNRDFGDRADGLVEGIYKHAGKFLEFRAGSYSGYNRWRYWLATSALGVSPEVIWEKPDDYKDKPFYELINFADNEGTIGPRTSANLAKDFAEHEGRILANADEYDARLYREWRNAFELASNGGAVSFH